MSSKFLAKAREFSEKEEGKACNVLDVSATAGETYYDSEQPLVTSAMEMMYYLSLCHVYSGEMEY
ncbi:MAG: hypothetical protein EOL98_05855 [Negativicutes bacterium]|nr:hypothetical protein [Negativicutes bacterium]